MKEAVFLPPPLKPRISRCGSSALLMDMANGEFNLDTQKRLWALCGKAGAIHRIAGVRNVVLGVNNVLVVHDPFNTEIASLSASLREVWAQVEPGIQEGRLVEIPVIYRTSNDFDLARIASHSQLSVEEIINIHTSAEYHVACIGWMPGFAFLTGLSPQIFSPRLASPRPRAPKNSVGIGGMQTGVIPMEIPSGWNLLGMTEIEMFDLKRCNPFLLAPGDRVRFVSRGIEA